MEILGIPLIEIAGENLELTRPKYIHLAFIFLENSYFHRAIHWSLY